MQQLERFRKINGNTLKIIACISMLIDHFAAGLIVPVVNNGLYDGDLSFETINIIYKTLRGIGRTAFPIFCFLLVEGFIHTKNRLRYALSLLIFGIISEPFYDVTFYAKEEIFNPNIIEVIKANSATLNNRCNVYFTLLLGLLVIWAIQSSFLLVKKLKVHYGFALILSGLASFLGIFVAEKISTDYHGYGVGLIIIFYVLRTRQPLDLIAAYALLCCINTEYLALPAFILMFLYNKKRGRKLGNFKYFFYAFYPVHILFVYLLRCFLIGQP